MPSSAIFSMVLQAVDALLDGLEVGERAAQPAVGDVELPQRGGLLADDVLGLLLGADEEDRAAARRRRRRRSGRRARTRLDRLLQVDDVDAVAGAEDVRLHLRVPALGLVAEVDAGLEQLLHGDGGAARLEGGGHRSSGAGGAGGATVSTDGSCGICVSMCVSGFGLHLSVSRRVPSRERRATGGADREVCEFTTGRYLTRRAANRNTAERREESRSGALRERRLGCISHGGRSHVTRDRQEGPGLHAPGPGRK